MTTPRKMPKTTSVDFEKHLYRLNQLVEKMETEQLSLDDSLKYFEEGIALIRQCQKTLNDASLKIQILTEKSGKFEQKDFKIDNE